MAGRTGAAGPKQTRKTARLAAGPFAAFRSLLLGLDAAGVAGFEGLVLAALAELTGLVFRLANSGSQFGRDATTAAGWFAIALEAKRYDKDLRLEDLVGKAALGGHVLGGTTDLWILGATSAVADDIARKLAELLEEHGISLLILDWTPNPLPPLTILLAGAADATLKWFDEHRPAE